MRFLRVEVFKSFQGSACEKQTNPWQDKLEEYVASRPLDNSGTVRSEERFVMVANMRLGSSPVMTAC